MSILESRTLVGNKRLLGSAFRLGDVGAREREQDACAVPVFMILEG